MPGYQLADADKARLDKRYFCVHCKLLLRDAVQTACGHLYCQSCLQNLVQIGGTAPTICVVDQEECFPAFPDNFMRREVIALVVCCTFMDNGCNWRGRVENLEEHIKREHNVVQFQQASQGELRRLGDGVRELNIHGVEMQRDLNEQRLRLTNLERKTADHELLFDRNATAVKRQLESVEHTLALKNVTLANFEEYVRQQELSSFDGQLVWKITEFARRRNEAVSGQQVSFHSPFFFTSRYGYKMCARIYLNGDGMGRGTHISVFFVVMRGQFDALLRWPFRQKVTFMLLDQDNVEHVIDAFRPDPSSSSFQRPRRETNIASGCPMFCPLTELNNHAYVLDDTMFLKIMVDTSDL